MDNKNTDWTGNTNSIFKALGASNHSDSNRASEDFYATSPVAIDLLLSKVELPHQILEPACGSGCLSVRLEDFGHEVKSYDIVNRGFGEVRDFFSMEEPPFDGDFAIVTNPPYKYAKEFVLHALHIVPEGCLVCMFLKTTFAEGKGRYKDLFRNYPPTAFYSALSVSCAPRTLILKASVSRAVPLLMPGGFGNVAIKAQQF